ncbi:heme/hemin ABC transporter substrate-binding protein [Pollutimonas sp. M17]|uniref:heme/hemin ABC transporter substrate-binding protein n=1 Tax=Pollutimonas sp. M17 TaxID=2962065 RepID=UPI0021F48F3A|nr:helical backbone metal receptor [Pollutimonas sp. M17]UYO92741.1 helical backbone metal receptor [Pollutimonas sp. M17]
MRACLAALCLSLSLGLGQQAQAQPERVVVLGGSVTEIVYDLGQEGRLVAGDQSSIHPPAALKLPRVGYYRSVPIEGVIAMRPDLVLASENAGPQKTLQRLSQLGIEVDVVSDAPSIESLYKRIEQIAGRLRVPGEGEKLIAQVRAEVQAAQAQAAPSRRALVLLNRTGPLMAAGSGTAADAVLTLAGLKNVLESQQGYKPISAEGLAALSPELIVISRASLDASGGMEKFRSGAGIASTPAAREGRVLAMDDLLILGLGPRVGQAIHELKEAAK